VRTLSSKLETLVRLRSRLRLVGSAAIFALIGVLTGISGEVPTAALMGRQQRLSGITVGSRRNQQDLVRALEATGIKPVIDTTFPVGTTTDAFQYELSASHFGKIGITIYVMAPPDCWNETAAAIHTQSAGN
jgi:NADPH:quinone reductase-like Zn-dependent oxidoreductase